MKKPLKLTVEDFVNFHLEGLTPKEVKKIRDKTSYPVKGAFTSAAFKAKIWDGRESLFDESGIGFLYNLDTVLSIVEQFGYDLDEDIDYDFSQPDVDVDVPFVDDDYLKEFVGHSYRDYQTSSVNAVIQNRKGILDIGTNGGKSLICAGISRAFDSKMKSVIIVPSENLVKQTYADYAKTDLNVVALTSKVAPEKRKKTIDDARHVIITGKLFLNCVEYFSGEPWVLIYDEAHQFGEVMADCLRFDMAHCPVRVGLTATLPDEKKDPYKRATIISHIGGGVLEKVSQKELISRGISSKLQIRMYTTSDPAMEELSKEQAFDWSVEESYLLTNMNRIEAIAEFIKSFDVKNTLILCHAGLGTRLAELLQCNVVVDETPVDKRSEWYAEYDKRDDMYLVATFGCAGTGLSINRIFRQFTIDVGKNEVYIVQGIGRGLRKDGVVNEIEVIDISAKTKYSARHRKDRIAIYKREEFPFTEEKEPIKVIQGDY